LKWLSVFAMAQRSCGDTPYFSPASSKQKAPTLLEARTTRATARRHLLTDRTSPIPCLSNFIVRVLLLSLDGKELTYEGESPDTLATGCPTE
jgi:hypothetical protein